MPDARTTVDTSRGPTNVADDDPDASRHSDPRLNEEYLRTLPGDGDRGRVVLVGAVHDHPASQYRAATVVEDVDPDALALELPPLAVPLFEQYATDARSPPPFGGEMSAAIQAADTDRVLGVDGPTAGFAGRLVRALYREDASASTVRSSLRAFASVTKHAAVCRLVASAVAHTSLSIEVDPATSYEIDRGDDPLEQAIDERDHVRRAQCVLQAFGSSEAGELRDAAREEHMADRVDDLRREGDVVAVVGIDHLDPVVDSLAAPDRRD